MYGFPSSFSTKQDLVNGVELCKSYPAHKGKMIAVLENIRDNTKHYTLKESARGKSAEEQTAEDYELTDNPACLKVRFGITDSEIAALLKELK